MKPAKRRRRKTKRGLRRAGKHASLETIVERHAIHRAEQEAEAAFGPFRDQVEPADAKTPRA